MGASQERGRRNHPREPITTVARSAPHSCPTPTPPPTPSRAQAVFVGRVLPGHRSFSVVFTGWPPEERHTRPPLGGRVCVSPRADSHDRHKRPFCPFESPCESLVRASSAWGPVRNADDETNLVSQSRPSLAQPLTLAPRLPHRRVNLASGGSACALGMRMPLVWASRRALFLRLATSFLGQFGPPTRQKHIRRLGWREHRPSLHEFNPPGRKARAGGSLGNRRQTVVRW